MVQNLGVGAITTQSPPKYSNGTPVRLPRHPVIGRGCDRIPFLLQSPRTGCARQIARQRIFCKIRVLALCRARLVRDDFATKAYRPQPLQSEDQAVSGKRPGGTPSPVMRDSGHTTQRNRHFVKPSTINGPALSTAQHYRREKLRRVRSSIPGVPTNLPKAGNKFGGSVLLAWR